MTAYLILVAVLVAIALGVWLVVRSRKAPGGSSGIDPDATHHPPEKPRERGPRP